MRLSAWLVIKSLPQSACLRQKSMLNLASGALSTSAGEEPDPLSTELQLLSKLQTTLENRQAKVFEQYQNSPGYAAIAIFRTGYVSNFPEWSLGGHHFFTNDLPKVFGGDGRYAGQTPTYTDSVGPLNAFMRKDLVNTLLIAANVYVIVNSHPEEDCNFPGAWWGRSGNPPVQQCYACRCIYPSVD